MVLNLTPLNIVMRSDISAQLITKMIQEDEDITKDATIMKDLQEEIPVLFELITSLHTYPRKLLSTMYVYVTLYDIIGPGL